MFSAFTNCLKVPELRQRILLTLGLLFVARVGAVIPLPGLSTRPLEAFFASQVSAAGNLMGLYDLFTGGAFLKGAICGLGIMPYISASIIMQLLVAILPSLAQMQQEGELGRQKISQYTRYLAIGVSVVQGLLLVLALANYPSKLFPGFDPLIYGEIVSHPGLWFFLSSTIFLTAGTFVLLWLGEMITQKGVGNGVSLLITVGILAGFPKALVQTFKMFIRPLGVEGGNLGAMQGVIMVLLLLVVIAATIAVTQAQRKIPVQYAKRIVGRKIYEGQSSFLPLKVNYAGVMPVIFANAILMFPQQVFAYIGGATGIRFFQDIAMIFSHRSWVYYVLYSSLILGFSYFWVSLMFRPVQVADEIKKNNGYIPGVRPGEATAKFLDFIMTRLTFAGAFFLTAIALFPDLLAYAYKIPFSIAIFFGGTGTLITVGVILDTLKQIETFLLQRHYDGFLKKGRIRGRYDGALQSFDTTELKNLGLLWYPLLVIFILGLISWGMRRS